MAAGKGLYKKGDSVEGVILPQDPARGEVEAPADTTLEAFKKDLRQAIRSAIHTAFGSMDP